MPWQSMTVIAGRKFAPGYYEDANGQLRSSTDDYFMNLQATRVVWSEVARAT